MKCTSCGNTNLLKTHFPLHSYGDGGAKLSEEVNVYLCLECGHYEFFSEAAINKYKVTVSIIKDIEQKIANLHCDLENLQNSTTTENIQKEIKTINEQLKSLDITIRQQQELKAKHSELTRQLQDIPNNISSKKSRLYDLESRLSTIKHNFENGSLLDGFELQRIKSWLARQ